MLTIKILHDLEFILGKIKQIRENMKKIIKSKGMTQIITPQGQGYQVEMQEKKQFVEEEKEGIVDKTKGKNRNKSLNLESYSKHMNQINK